MATAKRVERTLWLCAVLALLLLGCPAPLSSDTDGGSDAGEEVCRPPQTEHATLLNAPTTATVIRKTPAHPPTDGGLP